MRRLGVELAHDNPHKPNNPLTTAPRPAIDCATVVSNYLPLRLTLRFTDKSARGSRPRSVQNKSNLLKILQVFKSELIDLIFIATAD